MPPKEGNLFFASEIKALFAGGIRSLLSAERWASYLAYSTYGSPYETFLGRCASAPCRILLHYNGYSLVEKRGMSLKKSLIVERGVARAIAGGFSGTDAQDLQPYLMDFASYDVVSKYYSYAVQYYKNAEDEIQWLPICGIPQTIIANKTLFDQYGVKIPENYEEYVQACQQFL